MELSLGQSRGFVGRGWDRGTEERESWVVRRKRGDRRDGVMGARRKTPTPLGTEPSCGRRAVSLLSGVARVLGMRVRARAREERRSKQHPPTSKRQRDNRSF